ncbi:hypothetical protein PIIN_09858 [Serendipita indica DSM 11827]|uniref:Uncharacterized protein n=1 Tax=Serendipita indica (strain DSM 11827) TaxID=1109443 RepID=G4TX19_SERID|nr:hypothetical protein PIIN_09858 [Serendipita indica DSM 11827]
MITTRSAWNRVPTEIWQKIFRIYLGPPLSDTVQSDVIAYSDIFERDPRSLKDAYQQATKLLHTLELVCRYWRLVARTTMDDRVVFFHTDTRYSWPPNMDVWNAKQIIFISDIYEVFYGNPPLAQPMKGVLIDKPDRHLYPVQLAVEVPIVPIIKVMERDIEPSGEPFESGDPQRPRIQILDWLIPPKAVESCIRTLSHDVFRHITTLCIVLEVSSLKSRTLKLPFLQVLFIFTTSRSLNYLVH